MLRTGISWLRSHWRTGLDVTSSLAVLIVTTFVAWTTLGPGSRNAAGNSVPIPKEPERLVGLPSLGRTTAPVGIVEFADFQCPACGAFERNVFPKLRSMFIDTGRVLFAFQYLPLESIHPLARGAAEAAECAKRQGQFWPFHDRLFANPLGLTPEGLREEAARAGLDSQTFNACISGGTADVIRAAVMHAISLRLGATPTFLIGSLRSNSELSVQQIVSGSSSIDELGAAIDRVK